MDLGKHGGVAGLYDGLSTAELLDSLSTEVRARRASQVREWVGIIAWADQHVVEAPERAATILDGVVDTGVPIAGPGAPLVSEFGLMELVATLERTPDGGRAYVGQVVECAWRLPKLNAQVLAGRCPTWRAAQVADLTRPLSAEAAGWVDAQIAFAAGTCTWAQIGRLVAEAVARFDPELAEAHHNKAADARHFDIDTHQAGTTGITGLKGLVEVHGLLDAADAADLDHAIARRATLLGRLGHEGSVDVRRSVAAGELARNDLGLDLEVVDEETGEVTVASAGRKAELHVHLSDAALTSSTSREGCVGRNADTQSPVLAGQIKEWLQSCGTVIVRPVIDLADHVPVDSYEIPDRHRRQVQLRDHHCAFPWCGRPTTRCDLDHCQPWQPGDTTCACSLMPACRRHHRAKTFSGWRYAIVQPGSYLWLSPHGRHFLVDHHGTRALDPPKRLEPQTMDTVHDYETRGTVQLTPPCSGNGPGGGFEARKLAPQPPDQ